jgi:hypothetical protein
MAMKMSCRGAPGAVGQGAGLRAFTGFVAAPPCARPAQPLRAAAALPLSGGRGRLVIRAARVGGVEIPNQKRLETALTCARHPCMISLHRSPFLACSYIYGIGPTTAKAILAETVRVHPRRPRIGRRLTFWLALPGY